MSFENPLKPTLDNPTVCNEGMKTILAATHALKKENPLEFVNPLLIVISTTGISQKRDLPYLMMPMYHWMLKVPHEDKKNMEETIFAEMALDEAQRTIRNYLIIRPSFLTDGDGDGMAKIKVGTQEKPAVGYVIARNDVGAWLFQYGIRDGFDEENEYLGQMMSITT